MNSEEDAVRIVASLMALSARTAPKARGADALLVRVIDGGNLSVLAEEMRRYGIDNDIGFFVRDAANVAESDACLLIGAEAASVVGLDCGGCGYATCREMNEAQRRSGEADKPYRGPNCVIRMADLGIAVGSAVKTASIHNVDNRIMYSAGVGALRIGWMQGCNIAYGIPLKATGKNIYFDREKITK
jgi:uncharacterized ferredoxin-like protein